MLWCDILSAMLSICRFVEYAVLRLLVVTAQRSMIRYRMQYIATPTLLLVYSSSSVTRYNGGRSAAKIYMFANIIEDTTQRWSSGSVQVWFIPGQFRHAMV